MKRKVPRMIIDYDAAERRVFDQFICDGHKVARILKAHGRNNASEYVRRMVDNFASVRPRPKRLCAVCGTEFEIKSPWSKVCSDKCRKEFRRRRCQEYYEDNREKVLAARRALYRRKKEKDANDKA